MAQWRYQINNKNKKMNLNKINMCKNLTKGTIIMKDSEKEKGMTKITIITIRNKRIIIDRANNKLIFQN